MPRPRGCFGGVRVRRYATKGGLGHRKTSAAYRGFYHSDSSTCLPCSRRCSDIFQSRRHHNSRVVGHGQARRLCRGLLCTDCRRRSCCIRLRHDLRSRRQRKALPCNAHPQAQACPERRRPLHFHSAAAQTHNVRLLQRLWFDRSGSAESAAAEHSSRAFRSIGRYT